MLIMNSKKAGTQLHKGFSSRSNQRDDLLLPYETVLHKKQLFTLKCQWLEGYETLDQTNLIPGSSYGNPHNPNSDKHLLSLSNEQLQQLKSLLILLSILNNLANNRTSKCCIFTAAGHPPSKKNREVSLAAKRVDSLQPFQCKTGAVLKTPHWLLNRQCKVKKKGKKTQQPKIDLSLEVSHTNTAPTL